MLIVIVYYSRTGNTQAMANLLGEEARLRGHEARMVQISHTKKPGFFGCLSISSGNREADISNTDADLDLGGADVVILGAPIWGGRFAPFLRTYIERTRGHEGKPAGVFVSCSYPLQRASTFAPQLAEFATSKGLVVKGTMTASRKERTRHREIARAFMDELLGPAPAPEGGTGAPAEAAVEREE